MPYIKRETSEGSNVYITQSHDNIDPGVMDVYHATNVYVNRVLVALWEPPNPGTSALFKAAVPPDPPQTIDAAAQKYLIYSETKSKQNPTPVENVDGGDKGQHTNMVQGEITAKDTKPGDPPPLGEAATSPSPVQLAPGDTILGKLEFYLNKCLDEAAGGAWKRQGTEGVVNSPRNPNIIGCFENLGYGPNFYNKTQTYGDCIPWCAAFAGSTLKNSGAPYVKGGTALSAGGYNGFGQSIGKSSYSAWRRNDIAVVNFGSSYHVTFIRGVDPSANKFQMCGGNQSHNMTQTNVGGLDKIVYIGRAWPVDPAFDKPIVGSLSGPTPRITAKEVH